MTNNKQGPKEGLTGSNRQLMDSRGDPDIGRIKRIPLPEGDGKGYCPDQNGNIHWQENYYLPSALAFDRASRRSLAVMDSLSIV